MKVALCFIINYEHILNKEELWKEWIEPNKDIINVYFYYKDFNKIKSDWIRKHTIPPKFIYETSYYYVIPAYISIMKFALLHDSKNSWVCMLTESCCPIISPKKFRHLFYKYYEKSIMSWKDAWWNPEFHKRANLAKLPKELHLANDPWFILKRENVCQILSFINKQKDTAQLICSGGLANESLFAIILYCYNQLDLKGPVISAVTHITEWSRTTSATSPHLFKEANEQDIMFIESSLKKNNYAIFIRKISPEFPTKVLKHYIYEYNSLEEKTLILKEPTIFIYHRCVGYLYMMQPYIIFSLILTGFYYFFINF